MHFEDFDPHTTKQRYTCSLIFIKIEHRMNLIRAYFLYIGSHSNHQHESVPTGYFNGPHLKICSNLVKISM